MLPPAPPRPITIMWPWEILPLCATSSFPGPGVKWCRSSHRSMITSDFFFKLCINMLLGSSGQTHPEPLGFMASQMYFVADGGISLASVCEGGGQGCPGLSDIHRRPGIGQWAFTFTASYAFQSTYALSILVLKGLGQKLLSLPTFMLASRDVCSILYSLLYLYHPPWCQVAGIYLENVC